MSRRDVPVLRGTCGSCGGKVTAPEDPCPDCGWPMWTHEYWSGRADDVAGCAAARCGQGHVTAPDAPEPVRVTLSNMTPSCDCPRAGGKIRHQRDTCADPVVRRLNWFAP